MLKLALGGGGITNKKPELQKMKLSPYCGSSIILSKYIAFSLKGVNHV